MNKRREGKSLDCNNCNAKGSVRKKVVTKYNGAALVAGKLLLLPSRIFLIAGVITFITSAFNEAAGLGFFAFLLCAFVASSLGVPGFILTQKRNVLFCSNCEQVRDTL